MTEKITLDSIEKLLWDATDYKADAVRTDAIKVALQAYAMQLASELTPGLVTETLLHELLAHAGILLDTASRFDIPEGPVATKAEVDGLTSAVRSMDGNAAVKGDILLDRIHQMMEGYANRPATVKIPKPDLSPVAARLDSMEHLMAGLDRDIAIRLAEQANLISVMLEGAAGADLAPLQAQLEALTATVLAAQAAPGLHRELEELASEVRALQLQLRSLEEKVDHPMVQYRLEPVLHHTGDGHVADGLPDWERGLLEAQAEREDAARQEAALGAVRAVERLRRERAEAQGMSKVKTRSADRPGCFFNDDGTITCRICGIPKQPEAFYKDKAAWTGRKSACGDCESRRKEGKAR